MKLAAFFGEIDGLNARSTVARMCEAQLAHAWHEYEVFEVAGGAIGVVKTSERYGTVSELLQRDAGNVLAVSGVPTKNGNLSKSLANVVRMSAKDASDALSGLNGAFAAIFWNAAEKKAVIVTDFMGFQPIYIHRTPRGIALSSEIKAFSMAGIVPANPDPGGWGGFVVFGNSVGPPTQLSGVARLAGEKLEFTPSTRRFNSNTYWTWPERKADLAINDVSIEPIINELRRDVAAYSEYGVSDSTLLLSSGFDSRLILCLLLESGIRTKPLSVQQDRHYFGAEGKLALQIAKHLKVQDAKLVQPHTGNEREFSKLRYMLMNDVATPSLSLHISDVAGQVENLQGAVWEGYAPGYTLFQFTDTSMTAYLKKWGFSIDAEPWRAASIIFSDEFVHEMQSRLNSLVNDERELLGEDDYGVMRFIIRNRALNRTAPNPWKVYANSVLPFTPGINRSIWDQTCCLPPMAVCANWKLYKRVYRDIFPMALNVPFCSERGLFMGDDRFNPTVWWYNFLYELLYKWERRHKLPLIGRIIGKRTPLNRKAYRSVIEEVIRDRANLDAIELNSDGIRALLSKKALSPIERKARNLFFYKSIWQLVISGDINMRNSHDWLMEANRECI